MEEEKERVTPGGGRERGTRHTHREKETHKERDGRGEGQNMKGERGGRQRRRGKEKRRTHAQQDGSQDVRHSSESYVTGILVGKT